MGSHQVSSESVGDKSPVVPTPPPTSSSPAIARRSDGKRSSGLEELLAKGRRDGLCAVGDAEFSVDRRHVLLHSRERDAELQGDVLVRESACHRLEDFDLTVGELHLGFGREEPLDARRGDVLRQALGG